MKQEFSCGALWNGRTLRALKTKEKKEASSSKGDIAKETIHFNVSMFKV